YEFLYELSTLKISKDIHIDLI
ncbi:MAG: hypothetical protein XD93_1102, partial [candidate division WS6 bacterium 34_10]